MDNVILTPKQEELLATFEALSIQYKVDVLVNPEHYELKSPCAIDIEHDEEGNLVGIGVYDGVHSYYFTEVTPELKRQLER